MTNININAIWAVFIYDVFYHTVGTAYDYDWNYTVAEMTKSFEGSRQQCFDRIAAMEAVIGTFPWTSEVNAYIDHERDEHIRVFVNDGEEMQPYSGAMPWVG